MHRRQSRSDYQNPVQSHNNRRRHKKDWIKTGKKLDEIIATYNFCCKEDYLKLLPENLPIEFCAKDINELLVEQNKIKSKQKDYGHLIIWVFQKMELIEFTQIKNRSRYFKIR